MLRGTAAAAVGLWGVGCVLLSVSSSRPGHPAVGDLLLAAAVPIAAIALLSLKGAPRYAAGRGRTVVDGLIVVCALLLVARVAGVDRRLVTARGLELAQAHALGSVLLASMASVMLSRARPDARRAFLLLTGGLSLLALADIAVSEMRLYPGYGGPGAPVVAVWLLGLAALAAAAAAPQGSGAGLPTRASVFVPSVPLGAALIALGVEVARSGRLSSSLVWNGIAVAVFVILRQVLALLENISFWRSLEREVQSRTDELQASESRFRSLVQNSSEVITVVEPGGEVRYQSPSVARVFGHQPESVVARGLDVLVDPEDLEQLRAALSQLAPRAIRTVRCRVRLPDGRRRWAEIVASNLVDDPEVEAYVLNIRDETDRLELQQQLEHLAFHDPLTDLANRSMFCDRVTHALARMRTKDAQLAVLFIDLDDFKHVNDTHGHGAGDELLVAAGGRIGGALRAGDTVARLGGDEFAVLVEDIADEREPLRLAERILDTMREPFALAAGPQFSRASIGVATGPQAELDADELLRNADIAMYAAKTAGKGTYAVFDEDMEARVSHRVSMEGDLRLALARDELHLVYQPIVSLETGEIQSVEALARWDHPERGPVGPDEFIPIAEESGLILPLGRWVLATATRQLHEWRTRFPASAPLGVAVNFSPRQLRQDDVADEVTRALEVSGLPPSALTIEITEGQLMDDSERTIAQLEQLQRLGVKVAIDDFGTGFSSLRYLLRLPADTLKIDRSFIDRAEPGSDELALVQAAVDIGHRIGLDTVAEGIERESQVDHLRAMGCDLAQGYLFDRPLSVDAIDSRLAARAAAPAPALESVA